MQVERGYFLCCLHSIHEYFLQCCWEMLFIFSQHIYISFVHISIGTLVQDVNDCTDSEISRMRKYSKVWNLSSIRFRSVLSLCLSFRHISLTGQIQKLADVMWELGRAFWHMSIVKCLPCARMRYNLVCMHVLQSSVRLGSTILCACNAFATLLCVCICYNLLCVLVL